MSDEKEILKNLVKSKDIPSYARKCKDRFVYLTVPNKKLDFFLDDNWEIYRKNKKSFRLRKLKPINEFLEDEIWYILSNMGYIEMNQIGYRVELGDIIRENNFRVPVYKNPEITPKQIDVFAKDNDTVLFVECKASNSINKKTSFQKVISEINDNREMLMRSVQKHYGKSKKLKFGWIIATRNIVWSESDLKRADESNITVLSDENIDYYKDLIKHLGNVSKFQLLAEIFKKQSIPGLKLKIPALKGQMGEFHYYAFNIEPAKLLKIAYISHRAKMDRSTLVSYQRMLKKNRLKKIKKYIENDGIFPTSIVINLESGKKGLRFDSLTHHEISHSILGILELPTYYKSAWIIDGQHRLYGFSDSDYAEKTTLPVIAFENLPEPKQASMFVDINHEQVRVSTNLLADLYSDLFLGSPDVEKNSRAVISKIVQELRTDIASPLRNKISMVGSRRTKDQPLTINSIYGSINKSSLIGKCAKGNKFIPGPLFSEDNESTIKRAKNVLIAFFNEFKENLPEQWDVGSGPSGYICTNGGIIALMLVLKSICNYIDNVKPQMCIELSTNDLIEEILPYVDPVLKLFQKASPELISTYRSRLGSAGHRDSAYSMMIEINHKYPDFSPKGLREFKERRSSEYNIKARDKTYNIQVRISNFIINKLKEEFSDNSEQWWTEGIPLKVRRKIVQMREEDPSRGDYEKYFLLIHYRDIVLANWLLFKDKFAFSTEGKKENQVKWIQKLNSIRNKVFHPEKGIATKKELEFLDYIFEELENREIQ